MRALGLALVSSIACSVAVHAQPVPEPATQSAAPAQPPAPAPSPEAGVAAAIAGQRDALGRECALEEVLAVGDLRYLACGAAGVWVVRMQPGIPAVVVDRLGVDGDVVGFFLQDGYLWLRIASVRAQRFVRAEGSIRSSRVQPPPPISAPAPAPAAPQAPPPAPPLLAPYIRAAPSRDATVVEVGAGHVVIDMGLDNQVRDGQHIAFYRSIREPVGQGVASVRMELLAIGNVDGVAKDRARVVLGLNERVPRGSVARMTSRPLSGGTLAPPRVSNVWDVAFMARPFLVLENLGTGLFADLRAGYRPDFDMHFEALVMPIAIGTAEQGVTVPFAAVFAASYDSRLFEVGLGIGGQSVNDPAFDLEPGTGITALQRVRIGARDGLNIEGLSYVALFHSEFEFSSLRVQGQIPLSRGTWLLAAGSGGSLGIGHGEIGLRMLLSGNGDRDSFFLTTSIGGVHVFETPTCFIDCETPIDYAGPMVGVGGEWRL